MNIESKKKQGVDEKVTLIRAIEKGEKIVMSGSLSIAKSLYNERNILVYYDSLYIVLTV